MRVGFLAHCAESRNLRPLIVDLLWSLLFIVIKIKFPQLIPLILVLLRVINSKIAAKDEHTAFNIVAIVFNVRPPRHCTMPQPLAR
jgi:hypothetical protein